MKIIYNLVYNVVKSKTRICVLGQKRPQMKEKSEVLVVEHDSPMIRDYHDTHVFIWKYYIFLIMDNNFTWTTTL